MFISSIYHASVGTSGLRNDVQARRPADFEESAESNARGDNAGWSPSNGGSNRAVRLSSAEFAFVESSGRVSGESTERLDRSIDRTHARHNGSANEHSRSFQDIFVSLSRVDNSLYFMCTLTDFKFLADMIQHVPLPLRARYVFCCAPINKKSPYVCTMFLKVRTFTRTCVWIDRLYFHV